MRRSIRSSLFLLVAPFALTFTLVAWVVSSKIGPWLAQPLIANCGDKGYAEWVCSLQAGLMPWLLLGAGILILLSITAILSLGLFRAHLRELQQDVLEFQKGHRGGLSSDAPWEMASLIQLLDRILQSGADHQTDDGRPMRGSNTLKDKPQPRKQPEPPPHPAPKDAEDLEVSLEELDADIEKALNESPGPEPEREPEPQRAKPPASTETGAPPSAGKKNLAFPTRKCRKLIAMLGHRYPDVNFELITDVAESDSWTIREAELTEVFGQLLDNAGKWAKSQVNIFLAIKGNMLVFGVADDGPGVDPTLMPHLGEAEFQRSADQSAGDGLVTVRRTLDAHGGSLAFDRSRLGGLEAIVAIPGAPLPRHVSSKGLYH
ncbi:ATP-binding protein [Marinobacter sp. LN3S78]|uniref:ATP-binding protein n=1 Tax=Marinobacter sp. LN3S78 TaxID=3382300 RepID=UPI00387B8A22